MQSALHSGNRLAQQANKRVLNTRISDASRGEQKFHSQSLYSLPSCLVHAANPLIADDLPVAFASLAIDFHQDSDRLNPFHDAFFFLL
jgi:hypothetical protein